MKYFVCQINSRRHTVCRKERADHNSTFSFGWHIYGCVEDGIRKQQKNGKLAKEKFIFDESIPLELIANTPERWTRRMSANECMIFLFRLCDTATAHSNTHTQHPHLCAHSVLFYLLVLVEIVCRAGLPAAGCLAFDICTRSRREEKEKKKKRFGFWILFSIFCFIFHVAFVLDGCALVYGSIQHMLLIYISHITCHLKCE